MQQGAAEDEAAHEALGERQESQDADDDTQGLRRDQRRQTLMGDDIEQGAENAGLSRDEIRKLALRELAARKVRTSLVDATTEEIERLAAGPEEGVEQLSKSLMSLKPEFERAVQQSQEVSKMDDTKGGSSIIFATPPQGIGKAGGKEEPRAPPSAIPKAAGSPPDWMGGGQDLFGIREVLKQNANLTALLMDQSRRDSGSTTYVRFKDDQIKIPRFKDIDADKGITVSHLLLEWETYFKNKEVSPTVMAVLQAIDKGGNLYNWISSKTLTHAAALDDPDNINNWEWERFKSEIFASSLHTPVDQGAIFDAVSNFAFKTCTSIDHIRDEVTRYEIAVNKANAASLSENLPPAYLANKLYRSLPDDFRNLMAQRNSKYSCGLTGTTLSMRRNGWSASILI